MKIKQLRKVTAMLLGILMAFNFSFFSLSADAAGPNAANIPYARGVLAAGTVLTNVKFATGVYSTSGSSIYPWFNTTPLFNAESEMIASVNAVLEAGDWKVALSCSNDSAYIMYSINEGEYEEYNASKKIILDNFPICIKAYVIVNGQNGDISTVNFTEEPFL